MRTYTTAQGDKWDIIAHRELGSVSFTGELMKLNSRYLKYYIFPAGVVLELPEDVEEPPESGGLPPWKQVSG